MSHKQFDKKNIKNRGFFALVLTVLISAFGLSVAPEVVEGVAAVACEVAHCGD